MGCDTKGIVVTRCKDVRDISGRIQDAINNIKGEFSPPREFGKVNWKVNPEYSPEYNHLIFRFKDGTDQRQMFVHLDCDCDYKELGKKSIILNLGCWGNSVELMKGFLNALNDLGDCYLHANDCIDKPVKL